MRQLSYEKNFDFVPLGHDRISHWKTMFGLAHPMDPRLYLGSHFHPDCPMNILLFIHIHPYSSIFIHIHPYSSINILLYYICIYPIIISGFPPVSPSANASKISSEWDLLPVEVALVSRSKACETRPSVSRGTKNASETVVIWVISCIFFSNEDFIWASPDFLVISYIYI